MTGARLPPWHPADLVATFFSVGRLPVAPGTWGSAAALPIAWLLAAWLGSAWLFVASAAVFALGWWAAEIYARRIGVEDPGEVVVDEVAGQMLALAVVPTDLVYYAAAFALFRIADIWKPWPVSYAERRLAGGLGIMADDILAGGYAAILLVVAKEVLT